VNPDHFGFDKFKDFPGPFIDKLDAAVFIRGNDTVVAKLQKLFVIGRFSHFGHRDLNTFRSESEI
jgi:hypothetical protein